MNYQLCWAKRTVTLINAPRREAERLAKVHQATLKHLGSDGTRPPKEAACRES